jgi:hypothetical protein
MPHKPQQPLQLVMSPDLDASLGLPWHDTVIEIDALHPCVAGAVCVMQGCPGPAAGCKGLHAATAQGTGHRACPGRVEVSAAVTGGKRAGWQKQQAAGGGGSAARPLQRQLAEWHLLDTVLFAGGYDTALLHGIRCAVQRYHLFESFAIAFSGRVMSDRSSGVIALYLEHMLLLLQLHSWLG